MFTYRCAFVGRRWASNALFHYIGVEVGALSKSEAENTIHDLYNILHFIKIAKIENKS